MSHHPDQAYAHYVCSGLRQGFRIGYHRGGKLKSAGANLGSADEHPEIISEYLQKELELGCMLGPFKEGVDGLPPIHINRIRVIPKGHNTT